MQPSSDAQSVRAFLDRVTRRRDAVALLEGVAGGLAMAAVVSIGLLLRDAVVVPIVWLGALLTIAGATGRLLYVRAQRMSAAQLVEMRVRSCANTVYTASELLLPATFKRGAGGYARAASLFNQRDSDVVRSATLTSQSAGEGPRTVALTASPRMAGLVFHEAAQRVQSISLHELIPSRRAAVALLVSGTSWALIVARDAAPIQSVRSAALSTIAPNVARIGNITVTVTPPAYSGRAAVMLRDSSRIEALAGSNITLSVQGRADSLRVETFDGVQTIAPATRNRFVVSFAARTDGFVALQPVLIGSVNGARRLMGVTVLADQAPRVRLTQPTGDVRLSDPNTRLDISVIAQDDIALASLRLRYTKVSGSGERFTFDDGEIPLQITRVSATQWTGTAQWSLLSLQLAPGDLVVYRAVTTDNRPGAPPQESDALIAELLAIGVEAAAGFDMDEEFERYAVSQAMVVLKTERLIAAMPAMSRDSIAAAAQTLAVEQRKVRAEFVFMMGGELADEHGHEGDLNDLGEEAEAEAEGDILAGRLENQGRIALMRAVRAMSRAQTALNAVEVSLALTAEKSALSNIELAFSRTRILLRALSERESLDLTRRLSGDLSGARSVQRATVRAEANSLTESLQRTLARVATIAGSAVLPETAATTLSASAQEVLQQDASSDAAREIASLLTEASAAALRGNAVEAREQTERAALALARMLRNRLSAPGRAKLPIGLNRLEGALADVLRERSTSAPQKQ